jgi:hypothetical protein
MRNTRISDKIKIVAAVVPSAGAVAALTPVVVDGTGGFDRCMVVFQTGAAASGATFDAKLTESAASGGTYADITSAALTQVEAASGASKVYFIDVPLNSAKPYIKVSGAVGTDTFANSAVAILYRGDSYPVASWATEGVTV